MVFLQLMRTSLDFLPYLQFPPNEDPGHLVHVHGAWWAFNEDLAMIGLSTDSTLLKWLGQHYWHHLEESLELQTLELDFSQIQ